MDNQKRTTVHYDGALGHSIEECAARGCEPSAFMNQADGYRGDEPKTSTRDTPRTSQELQRNDAHRALDRIIQRRQGQAREDLHALLLRIRIFGDVLISAYGRDISRLEMLEALEKEFCQGLRDVR